jgi:uncharacterized protein YjgD (DUF1641 family)
MVSDNSSNGSNGLASLQDRLNEPGVAEGLNRLLDRMGSINFAIEAIEGFVARGDVIAESVADTVKDLKAGTEHANLGAMVKQAPEMFETGTKLAHVSKHMNFDELEKSAILERLTDRQTLATLNELFDKLPLIAFTLEALEGFLNRGDTIVENVAAMVGDLKKTNGLPIEQIASTLETLPKLKALSDQLLSSQLMGKNMEKIIGAGVGMVDAGMLDPQVVGTLGELGKKMVEAFQEVNSRPVPPVGGMWAMFKASRDPDVQKSTGFLIAFAKAFAKYLK